jgi:aspartate/methionine/tyrosine aminotransferase
MIITPAQRTLSVKLYYFSVKNPEIAALRAERVARGEDPVINLGIGSPDRMPPQEAIDELCRTAQLPDSHKYQNYRGLPELRKAFAQWYERYYGVTLDPETEIQPLMGSKEGILLISLAFVNPGDKVLVPDPGYPTYTSASLLSGARVIKYDLKEENGWYPDFEALERMDLRGVKMMWTNYPGMPTGARASRELYARLVDFATRHKILIINDNPYSFIRNREPLSILSIPGAKACCLEMNSLSKAHNMAGWRLGLIAGEAAAVREVLKVKSQMDSGIFRPLQLAAVEALKAGPEWFDALNAEYRRRAVVAGEILDTLGAVYDPDSAGLFLFGRVDVAPEGGKTPGEVVSDRVLYGAGVFLTPGFIFGRNGENYIRISLCAPVPVLEEALERCKLLINNK